MRYRSIRNHLRPYIIKQRRTTTINHAFASALAPNDKYDDVFVRTAVLALGQNPDADLLCVYCDGFAETWDHVFPTVMQSRFSGYGHRVGNLLPCCKRCNSQKGNQSWTTFLQKVSTDGVELSQRRQKIEKFIANFSVQDKLPDTSSYEELDAVRREILRLVDVADRIASEIRQTHHSNRILPECPK